MTRQREYNAVFGPSRRHPSPFASYIFKSPNGVACLRCSFYNKDACLHVPADLKCVPVPHFLQQARVPGATGYLRQPYLFTAGTRACCHEACACTQFFTAGTQAMLMFQHASTDSMRACTAFLKMVQASTVNWKPAGQAVSNYG